MTQDTRTKALHLIAQVTDDSSIAAYLRIPRETVAAMRRGVKG